MTRIGLGLVKPKRPHHRCDVPPTGSPVGFDLGDVWYCECGKPWLAYDLPGSRYEINWKRISRIGAWWRTL